MKEINTNESAIEYFVGVMRDKGRSASTIKNYASDLRQFVKEDPHPTGATLCGGGQKALEKYTQQIQNSDKQLNDVY